MRNMNFNTQAAENLIISVFKTSIEPYDLNRIKKPLDSIDQIIKWNVDFEDCDHILRVVSNGNTHNKVIEELKKFGFKCLELED